MEGENCQPKYIAGDLPRFPCPRNFICHFNRLVSVFAAFGLLFGGC